MANIKSQIKRNRQNAKRRLRNRNFRGAARTAVKEAHGSLVDGAASKVAVLAAISALDKAAQKGAIHRRNAARRKSRLMKQLGAIAQPAGEQLAGEQAQPKAAKKAATSKAPAKKAAAKKSSK